METDISSRPKHPDYKFLETPHAFLIELDLPGLSDQKAVDIEFTDRQMLVVKGKITRNTPTSSKTTSGDGGTASTGVPGYQTTEMSFERTFKLERTIDQAYAHAKLADGVLTIVLPKAPSKKIEVQ